LLKYDRGKYVRNLEGYLELVRSIFTESEIRFRIIDDGIKLPYNHAIFELHKVGLF
jgi:hypothetical protein